MKEKKYRITLTEHQLMLIANCVEDCHRFASGQTELANTLDIANIKNRRLICGLVSQYFLVSSLWDLPQ